MNEKLIKLVQEAKRLFDEEKWEALSQTCEKMFIKMTLGGYSNDNFKLAIYIARGVANGKLGKNKKAIEDFDNALKIDSKFALIYGNRGNFRYDIGDYKGAIADYNKALEIEPHTPEAYNGRGVSKNSIGDHIGAIQDFNKVLEINPEHENAYNNRGLAHKDLGDYKNALADFDKVLEINPEHEGAYSNRAGIKNALKEYKSAIADCNKALEITKNLSDAYNNRGSAKGNLGDHKGAIADFDKALEINPEIALMYNNRGIAKNNLGDYKEAIADFDEALRINPNDKYAIHNRAVSLTLQFSEKQRKQDIYQIGKYSEQAKEIEKKIDDIDVRIKSVFGELKNMTPRIGFIGIISCFVVAKYATWHESITYLFIALVTAILSSYFMQIVYFYRDKNKYWFMLEKKNDEIAMSNIIESSPEQEKEFKMQLFSHYNKLRGAQMLFDIAKSEIKHENKR